MMGTRPQTIGYALTDSPAGLAAWMYDYNNGEPERLLGRDEILDDVTLYWLTNTATSAARLYWETMGQSVLLSAAQKTAEISLPWPSRCFRTRSIAHRRHGPGARIATSSTSTRSTRADTSPRGKQPELFAAELRAAFRSLRPAH